MKRYLLLVLLLVLGTSTPAFAEKWSSFIDAIRTKDLLKTSDVIVIDARSEKQYSEGHIPGAINIPGKLWRTAKTKPKKGDSQYIFRTAEGRPDIAKYERLLGDSGVKNSDTIIVYGNHGGKADGSIPALLLRWLGHEKVAFLDGIGTEEWTKAGLALSTKAKSLESSSYTAKPIPNFVWNLSDVQGNLDKDSVVFYDTRSVEEFSGENPRSNQRAGHIPGAVNLDYKKLLDKDNKILSPLETKKVHAAKGITKDKTVVLYCQTATRVSLPALALFDLGYTNIAIYDASWHEYGNRSDTTITSGPLKTAKLK